MDAVTSRDDFETWLFDMDDALEEFRELVPGTIDLDNSVESLDPLEAWLLGQFDSPSAMLAAEAGPILDGSARYLGETMRLRVGGGTWDVVLDDPNFVYGQLPIMNIPGREDVPFCPHFTVRATAKRRTGNVMSTVVTKAVERSSGETNAE